MPISDVHDRLRGCIHAVTRLHGKPSKSSLIHSKITKRQPRPPFLRVDHCFRAAAKGSPPDLRNPEKRMHHMGRAPRDLFLIAWVHWEGTWENKRLI